MNQKIKEHKNRTNHKSKLQLITLLKKQLQLSIKKLLKNTKQLTNSHSYISPVYMREIGLFKPFSSIKR